MALDKASLLSGIETLLGDLQNASDREAAMSQLSSGLADLIDAYVKTGTVIVAQGIPVTVVVSTGIGATSGPGTGTIS